jgi:prophage regulatory protein
MSRKILFYEDLAGKGIPFHRVHISKMVREKRFPPPFKVGAKRNAWFEETIDAFLDASAKGRATEYLQLLEASA